MSDDLLLAYSDLGQGPGLVLLHGWSGNSRLWEAFGWTRHLEGRRLLALDLRGHGASAKPHEPEAYRMEALAGDVLALLDATGLDEADLFGYSLGALMALWTAVLEPGRVRSLVMGGVNDQPQEWVAQGQALRGKGPMTAGADASRDFARLTPGNDLEALAALLEAGPCPPPREQLAVFGGEARVVAGTEDDQFGAARRIAECLPGGRFVPIEGTDHNATFGDQRFMEAVLAFLEEVSPLP